MSVQNQNASGNDREYYMKDSKFIRDLVHGYVYLTKFDLALIDTPEFQRLKDIRQLTCQNVYPSARHTRFEHSLGVLELTRRALDSLNQNGILVNAGKKDDTPLFSDHLIFNASLAALLHDVGHCPFSHMGEAEFDREEVFNMLCDMISKCTKLKSSRLLQDLEKEKKGGTHEQMSCVVILDKLYDKLSVAFWYNGTVKEEVDFDLIIRSIIGMPFSEDDAAKDHECKKKNVIIELINSPIFDMDKLDYIMRDAYSTGIGTPHIDTQRLFRNMYIRSEQDFTLVFLHRALPALQNMVESRDALYMYVYNHHATVFSDFMYSYIFRRMAHSADTFLRLVKASIPEGILKAWNGGDTGEKSLDAGLRKALALKSRAYCQEHPFYHHEITHSEILFGIVPKTYLFSPEALLDHKRSDSDMISLLHNVYYNLSEFFNNIKANAGNCDEGTEGKIFDWDHAPKETQEEVRNIILPKIKVLLKEIELQTTVVIPIDDLEHMFKDMGRVYTLIDKYNRREFLKPWWKTNFEFTTFMRRNFPGDLTKKLSEWICNNDEKKIPRGDEFRSQLAKHVIYITQGLKGYSDTGLRMSLQDGDFFVIQRQALFYDEGAISKISVALKRNEIVGKYEEGGSLIGEYIVDTLTKISPQKDYYGMFEKNEFYIFSKPLPKGDDRIARERHYRLIEDIFVHVAETLIEEGKYAFQSNFVDDKENATEQEREARRLEIGENEEASFEKTLKSFVDKKGFKKEGGLQ